MNFTVATKLLFRKIEANPGKNGKFDEFVTTADTKAEAARDGVISWKNRGSNSTLAIMS